MGGISLLSLLSVSYNTPGTLQGTGVLGGYGRVTPGTDEAHLFPLYPQTEPYAKGRLEVGSGHSLYYEQCGNKDGIPVVFVHGGPGGGFTESNRGFFNPDIYRIILFDQRGAGQSTPSASLIDNNTWELVKDMEKLRAELGVERWVVFGGSWGSTLSLAYAEDHPERVSGLVLRGIFMLRKAEINFFYQWGASMIFPDAWEPYEAHIPPEERGDFVRACADSPGSEPRIRDPNLGSEPTPPPGDMWHLSGISPAE